MRPPILSIIFAILISLVSAKIDNVKEKTVEAHGDVTKLKGKEAPEHVDHKKLFAENFQNRRIEHQTALKSIYGIGKEKRRPFLEDVLKNVKTLLQESRETLERTAHRADAPFPHDSELLKDALSKLLENTAFFTDLSLGFSEFFEKKMQKDRKLKTLLVWAFNYSTKTGIFDEKTGAKVNLMAQQHELIERAENYFNAYDKERARESVAAEEAQRKEKKSTKNKKVAKGEL